jgi:hypothetical protein
MCFDLLPDAEQELGWIRYVSFAFSHVPLSLASAGRLLVSLLAGDSNLQGSSILVKQASRLAGKPE